MPVMNTPAMMSAGTMYCHSTAISMSMPMDMKNSAEKMSRTGAMVLLSTSEYSVSPSTVPMMNAPTAAEMCSCCPTSARPKHSARLTTSITSVERKRATNLMMCGATSAPMNSAQTKNSPSRATKPATSPIFAVPLVAMPESMLSRMTAAKSSTTSMPTIRRPCRSCSIPASRSTLKMIAELLMESAAPRNIASMPLHPSSVATS